MSAQPLARARVPHPGDVPIPQELQARDWIFSSPASYRAGVREALAWMASSPDHVRVAAMQLALRVAQPTSRTTRPVPRAVRTAGS